jgi:hypothetical protein
VLFGFLGGVRVPWHRVGAVARRVGAWWVEKEYIYLRRTQKRAPEFTNSIFLEKSLKSCKKQARERP